MPQSPAPLGSSPFSEANIQTTITCLKLANCKSLPVEVRLVADNEELSAKAWRKLALAHLEEAEYRKAKGLPPRRSQRTGAIESAPANLEQYLAEGRKPPLREPQ